MGGGERRGVGEFVCDEHEAAAELEGDEEEEKSDEEMVDADSGQRSGGGEGKSEKSEKPEEKAERPNSPKVSVRVPLSSSDALSKYFFHFCRYNCISGEYSTREWDDGAKRGMGKWSGEGLKIAIDLFTR